MFTFGIALRMERVFINAPSTASTCVHQAAPALSLLRTE
jgi:hypothetical protein